MTTPPPASRCPFLGDAAADAGVPVGREATARAASPPGGTAGPAAAPVAGKTTTPTASAPAAGAAGGCRHPSSPVRWGLAATGFLCVAVGAVGTVVPGLPTTIFLIVASWCFTRSCPWLDERMRTSRIFAPYARFLDPDEPMPARTRATVIALVWLFAGASAIWLAATEHPVAAALTAAAAVAGTIMVLRWRRESEPAAAAAHARSD